MSRSLVALDQNSTIIVGIEMSQSSWLVAGMLPEIERQPRKKLEPSPERLLALVHRWRHEAVGAGARSRGLRLPSKPAVIVSSRRNIAPFGLADGLDGALGRQWVERSDGRRHVMTGTDHTELAPATSSSSRPPVEAVMVPQRGDPRAIRCAVPRG